MNDTDTGGTVILFALFLAYALGPPIHGLRNILGWSFLGLVALGAVWYVGLFAYAGLRYFKAKLRTYWRKGLNK